MVQNNRQLGGALPLTPCTGALPLDPAGVQPPGHNINLHSSACHKCQTNPNFTAMGLGNMNFSLKTVVQHLTQITKFSIAEHGSIALYKYECSLICFISDLLLTLQVSILWCIRCP